MLLRSWSGYWICVILGDQRRTSWLCVIQVQAEECCSYIHRRRMWVYWCPVWNVQRLFLGLRVGGLHRNDVCRTTIIGHGEPASSYLPHELLHLLCKGLPLLVPDGDLFCDSCSFKEFSNAVQTRKQIIFPAASVSRKTAKQIAATKAASLIKNLNLNASSFSKVPPWSWLIKYLESDESEGDDIEVAVNMFSIKVKVDLNMLRFWGTTTFLYPESDLAALAKLP